MESLHHPHQGIVFLQFNASAKKIGLALLFLSFFVHTITSQVLINEVITDPQVDWSTNAFDGTDGSGTIDANDEWIELYITANGLDLTNWTIEMNDGTDASGTIAAGGAFATMNYISGSGGTFDDTDAGDYIVLGQPNTGSMDATITVILRDNASALVDQVEIAAGSGTMFTGLSTGITNESVCRIPNGTDTDIDATDFVLTQSTLGANNSPIGTVLINEVITDPQVDWSTNGFDGTNGGSTVSDTDEWIELYIGTTGLNLTKWIITADDGDPITGDLTSRDVTGNGAFQEITYFGSGSFTSTVVGDYLVLGNPQGGEAMNNEVTVTLVDPYGSTIDFVEIATGSGTGFDGNANNLDDESVCRIPNGQDTDVEAADFVQTRATLGANNSPQGVVLINEVVTDPFQDWSTNGFDGTDGSGTVSEVDEWIELYIGTSGLNLIKWNIAVIDGTNFSGDLTNSGAFDVVNYVGSGSFNNTVVGDYLILGNPDGSAAINNNVYITLTDPYGSLVDDVEIGDDEEGDGSDGAPNGASSGIADESVFRVPAGEDTDVDAVDFQKGLPSLGLENGVIYVDASAPDDTGSGTLADPKQLIQSGINIAPSRGSVEVAAGTYAENLTISSSLTLRGANRGIAGNGTRGAETINDVSGVGITITTDTVTVDGIQLGTDASTSSITNGVVATDYTGISIQNNVLYTNSVGLVVGNESTGSISVTDNVISMLAIEDATSPTDGSIGIAAFLTSGDLDLDLTNNDISNASLGISTYSLQSSVEAIIDGGTFTGCMTGILPSNADGVGGFYPSALTIQNVTMSGFATDSDVTNIDTETAVYVITAGGTAVDDITITINNLDVSGVNNDLSNYSGIVVGDFPSASDGAGIDATIINCNVHDNENRGIYVRGGDAVATISQSAITGNGFDPTATGGNAGFSVIVREGANATVSNSFITNPAALSGAEDIPSFYYTAGLGVFTGGSLTVSGSNLDQNGNGFIAQTSGIDLSGNYFNTTDEATIDAAVSSNDFTPWLSNATDTDVVTAGFQGDFSDLIVGVSAAQTGFAGRIEEGVSLVNTSGTVSVNAGTYAENFTITKAVTINGANQGIAGSGLRGSESIIEPGSANVGLTIGAIDVTIDGLQFGTDNTTSNHTTAINNTGFAGLTATNNVIHANGVGVLLAGLSSGTNTISDNLIEMLNLEDPLNATNPSIGIYATTHSGTAVVNINDNYITNASYGVLGFALTSATNLTVDGGNITGCTKGIEVDNADGTGNYSPSAVTIQNVTMSGFTGPDAEVLAPDAQAGIYLGAFSTLGSGSAADADDLTATIDNVDISGVSNTQNDYAGIYVADFNSGEPSTGTSDLIAINATITNSNIHDNLNRGIYTRGANTTTNVSTSTFTGNGSNAISTGSSLAVFASGTINASNNFFTNPGSGTVQALFSQQNGIITARDNSFDQNSNGELSGVYSGGAVDMSRNWLGETDEATIGGIVDLSSDFTPWIASGTDTDGGTNGFQPDLSNLIVGPTGAQTSGERTQEGHDMVDVDGTVTLLLSDYADSLIVTRNVFFDPEANTTIDNIAMDGGNLSLLADLEINDSLALSTGVLDTDLDDGNRDNDPVLILNNPYSGTASAASHVEGKIQFVVDGIDPFEFPVGDEGDYRPVILDPTNATTFSVSHISDIAPIGGGANGDMRDLHGDVSSVLGGFIRSTLHLRYWDIDVVSGTPGDTDVTLQITGSDNASDASSLGVIRFDATNWVELNRTGFGGTGPYTVTGLTDTFSEFSVYSNDEVANPLPVELVEFTGRMEMNDVRLSWITMSEVNSDYFLIERSTDGEEFTSFASISSHGNSNERHDYSYMDMNVGEELHYYRLKMVDFDGSYDYSPTIQVIPDFNDARVQVYPNPAANFIQIQGVEVSHLKRLTFYDLNGRIHKIVTSFEHQIEVSDLSHTHYLILLELVDGSVFEGKFVKE